MPRFVARSPGHGAAGATWRCAVQWHCLEQRSSRWMERRAEQCASSSRNCARPPFWSRGKVKIEAGRDASAGVPRGRLAKHRQPRSSLSNVSSLLWRERFHLWRSNTVLFGNQSCRCCAPGTTHDSGKVACCCDRTSKQPPPATRWRRQCMVFRDRPTWGGAPDQVAWVR